MPAGAALSALLGREMCMDFMPRLGNFHELDRDRANIASLLQKCYPGECRHRTIDNLPPGFHQRRE